MAAGWPARSVPRKVLPGGSIAGGSTWRELNAGESGGGKRLPVKIGRRPALPTRRLSATNRPDAGVSSPIPKPNPAPLDSPGRRRLPPLLRRAWYGLNQAFRRRIAHTGVTPDQFTAMRTLLEGEPEGMTQRALTEAMSSDPNTVASLLERMEEAGWIERRPHERDKRAYRIRLLEGGVVRYQEVRELAVGLQADVLGGLPESERERFLEQLETVALACRQAADDSGRNAR